MFSRIMKLLFCFLSLSIFSFAVSQPSYIKSAKAIVKPAMGQKAKGIVTFEQQDNGIKVVARLEGLTPGKHGFHIHEHGDCGSNGASAGAHFNPTASQHGGPDSTVRHVGDLGNVVADSRGYAYYERVDRLISFSGPHSIIGRSIIVHAKEDDFTTQPTGGAGDRIGCGVIEAVK